MKDPQKESSLSFKNIFQRETKLATYIIVCMTIVVISLSYALFFKVDSNSKNQEVIAGDLKFTYTDGKNQKISSEDTSKLICFQPMSYEEAELYREECSYVFSVQNTGTLKANYSIGLKALVENYETNKSKLKIIIRKKENEVFENIDPENPSKYLSDLSVAKSTEEGFLLEQETEPESEESVTESEEPLDIDSEEPLKEEQTVDSPLEEPEASTSLDDILILIQNAELGSEDTLEYQIQIYFDETKYEDTDEKQKVAYQIVGTGLVHETQPITTDSSSPGPESQP